MYPGSNPYATAYYADQGQYNVGDGNYVSTSGSTSSSDPAGSFWKGTDGNVWVYGADGANSAGTWDNNTSDYWGNLGYSQIADPYASTGQVAGVSDTRDSYYSGSGTGGSGGSTGGTSTPIDTWLIDQQINSANSALGRLTNQRSIGKDNINRSYTNADTSRQNQFTQAQGKYDTTVERNNEDYTNTRSGIRRDSGQQYTALQRLLGSAGAGRSSAAQILTPFAVGREAAQRFGGVQDQFSRNSSDLDMSWQNTVSANEAAKKELEDQKRNKLNELSSGIDSRNAGLQDQLYGLQLQRQKLLGGELSDIQRAVSPYQTKIQELLSGIDNYGKLAVSAPKAVGFSQPNLEQYNYSRFATPTMNGQRSPVADYTNPFVVQQRPEEEEQLRVQ